MTIILDAGALVAVDRDDRAVLAMLRVAQAQHVPVRTSGGVVGQVWRHGARQARLAKLLLGVDTAPIDGATGRRVGELLRASGSADVIDAHVAVLANPRDTILTSDPADIRRLLETRAVDARIVAV